MGVSTLRYTAEIFFYRTCVQLNLSTLRASVSYLCSLERETRVIHSASGVKCRLRSYVALGVSLAFSTRAEKVRLLVATFPQVTNCIRASKACEHNYILTTNLVAAMDRSLGMSPYYPSLPNQMRLLSRSASMPVESVCTKFLPVGKERAFF